MRRTALVSAGAMLALFALGLVAYVAIDPADDPGPWALVFEDSFDDDRLDASRWNTCHWWNDDGCTISSNDEMQWYRPEQVTVRDGALRLTADRRDTVGSEGRRFPYASGMVTTGPPTHDDPARFEFTYGRVEARLRVPAGTGLWSAVWLLPSSTESRPEIDALEVLGDDPTTLILHLHPEDREEESLGQRHAGPDLSEGWHDLRLDWAPGRIDWFIDDERIWTVTGDQVPSEPMYLIANLAVGGDYPGPPDETTRFPANFSLERVRVWQRSA